MSGKVWLSCSVPRPSVCHVRYTESPSRRKTFTANPPPAGASMSAPNGLSAVENHSIRFPVLSL
jgi:hypothetical protein